MDTELAPLLVSAYAFCAGYLLGWSTPRGNTLKRLQHTVLEALRRFYD